MEQLQNYNVIDVFVVLVMTGALLLGLWKGFFRTLTAVAGVLIGVLVATKYHVIVEAYLNRVSSLDPFISTVLSMILLFIAVQAVFVLIRKALDAVLDFTRLGWLDRILGAGMGVGAGFLLVSAVVQFLIFAVPEWPAIRTSQLLVPIERLSRVVMSRVPENIRAPLERATDKWWKGAVLDSNVPSGSSKRGQEANSPILTQGRVR